MTTLPEEAVKAAADAAHEELMLMAKQMNVPMEYTQSISVNNYRVMRAALTAALPFLPVQGAVKKLDLTVLERLAEYAEQYDHPDDNGPFPDIQDAMITVGDLRQARKLLSILSALEPSAARELHGPFGYIVGHRDLKEDYWHLDDVPVTDADVREGIFSVPLYALTDPFKEIGVEGPANAASPAARSLALEEGFRKGLEAACEVIDAHIEYDRQMCCDGRECGCYGATVHQSMQHYIRALSFPDHADAGKVEGDGWLPIESAPKDGTPFLVFVPDDDFSSGTGIDVIWYDEEQWLFGANTPFTPANDPTHWRPLPSAPASEGAE